MIFTGQDYEKADGTVGLAYVKTMCSSSATGVVEDSPTGNTFTVATAAHELGHNWGCNHDSSGNTCDARQFIMAAILTNTAPSTWSTCSKSTITATQQSLGASSCLRNAPRPSIGGARCGDGVRRV